MSHLRRGTIRISIYRVICQREFSSKLQLATLPAESECQSGEQTRECITHHSRERNLSRPLEA